jgi:hypothetical protein
MRGAEKVRRKKFFLEKTKISEYVGKILRVIDFDNFVSKSFLFLECFQAKPGIDQCSFLLPLVQQSNFSRNFSNVLLRLLSPKGRRRIVINCLFSNITLSN